MTQIEMTEKFSEKMNISREEAQTALEAADWNTLTATHRMEQEQFRRLRELDEAAAACDAMEAQAAADEPPADGQAAADEGARKATRRRGQAHGNLGGLVRRVIACGNRNRFEVRKGSEPVLELPVTALALLLLCAFWVCLPLLAIGLFAGFRYSFIGKELGRGDINGALSKAADAADHMKQAARA